MVAILGLVEELMCTVVEAQCSKKTVYPFTKVALTVTNCTSNRLVDGVARFITKNEQALNDMDGALDTLWTN